MKTYCFSITLLLLIAFVSSCGDIFNAQKKIVGNYYLVEGDSPDDLAVSYKVNNVFSQRVPGQVIKYGYDDTFLVAETADFNRIHSFYIINMSKDYDTAKLEETYKIGPITREEFESKWQKKVNVNFQSIK